MKQKAILLTGGCGYIGSHLIGLINTKKTKVVCIDNISNKSFERLQLFSNVDYYKNSISDKKTINEIFKKYSIDDVYHFAAFKNPHESNINHDKYIKNNLYNSITLLKSLVDKNIKNFIFSSSASVYGIQNYASLCNETMPSKPISIYGLSKSIFEQYLIQLSNMYNFRYGILRYFNVVGKNKKFKIKKKFNSSNSLFDNCSKSILNNKKILKVYGNDFNTKDGTAIRDYIHVCDLVKIHTLTMNYLNKKKTNLILNCGYGKGFSVLEVVKKFEEIYKRKINLKFVKRNMADPEKSIADINKMTKILKFNPIYDDLNLLIKSHMSFFE